ncbi:hypothetical protein CAAU_1697 [Caloramator australicus RC3]|uniref:Flagellar motor switch protein FliM n=1 Tax=Caloramator australicus RC3 TaxID=857293 RepID=I7LH53_9CLOT|nr:hypothetical protein CAAU_1697 [Caloramator australicus RC3]
MGEILSQSEIDALLSALSAGEIELEEHSSAEKQKVKNTILNVPINFQRNI